MSKSNLKRGLMAIGLATFAFGVLASDSTSHAASIAGLYPAGPPAGLYPSKPPAGLYPTNPPAGLYPSKPPAGL